MKLYFGSNNRNKIKEIKTIIPTNIELLTINDFNNPPDPEEIGLTLAENAILKAKSYYEWSKIPSFADDSGLEVEYLNGEPGIYSARYSGEHGNDKANIDKLLNKLKNADNRKAVQKTVIAYFDGKKLVLFEGAIEGLITLNPLGINGFGYDSVFYIKDLNKTLAELEPNQKNNISHRSLALQKFIEYLYIN